MSRRSFLWGMLCGTFATAMVAFGAQPLISRLAVTAPAASTVRLVSGAQAPALPVAVATSPPDVSLPTPLPPGTYRFEFNGRPVYIMPLVSQ